MEKSNVRNVVKIGVFYDGNYMNHISEFYVHKHSIGSRISLKGLQEFALHEVSRDLDIDPRDCRIVESHVYKGRVTAAAADERDAIYGERVFDDACMYDGIATHYLPIKSYYGRRQEKGLDVWMALDAYEMTVNKNLDVVVIVTSDSNFSPLFSKLHGINAKTMLLGWDISWENEEGKRSTTTTSRDLITSASRYIQMDEVIESRSNESSVQNIFVKYGTRQDRNSTEGIERQNNNRGGRPFRQRQSQTESSEPRSHNAVEEYDESRRLESTIKALKNGYGFISYPDNNLFFHASDLMNPNEFDDMEVGDIVEFQIGENPKGEPVARCITSVWEDDDENELETDNYDSADAANY